MRTYVTEGRWLGGAGRGGDRGAHDTGATHTYSTVPDGPRRRPRGKIVPKKRLSFFSPPTERTRGLVSASLCFTWIHERTRTSVARWGWESEGGGEVRSSSTLICTLTQLEPQSTLKTLTRHGDDTNTNHRTTLCFSSFLFGFFFLSFFSAATHDDGVRYVYSRINIMLITDQTTDKHQRMQV